MSLSYTVGNWSVVSNEVDTIATPKTLSIPDLDYANDFSATVSGNEVRCENTSGTQLEPVERLRFAREKVADIYNPISTLKAYQLPSPVGYRVLAESLELLSATNTVSASEVVVPIRIWTCLTSSTHNVVTGAALKWALLRHIASLFTTGATDEERLIQLFRGDLNPTI